MYAGIDLGSTNIKAAIYDDNFNLIDRQSRPVVYIRDNGFVEFDAYAYCQELTRLLADMVKKNGVTDIRQIAFTGQAESLVVVGEDGKPLMNAISWMDERSTEECEALSKRRLPDRWQFCLPGLLPRSHGCGSTDRRSTKMRQPICC